MSWLFSICAGIRPLSPGFKEIEIRPYPGGSFTFAKAEYNSIYGKIVSHWEIQDDVFTLNIEVPMISKHR